MSERAAKRQRLKHKHTTHTHKKSHSPPPRTPTSSSSSSSFSSSPSQTSTENLPPFRKATVKALETLLQAPTHNEESKELALQIESSLFSTHGSTCTPTSATNAYTNKLRSLKYNISQNADLKMRIIKGDISPAAVPRLTPEEMLPTQERDAQREIEAKAYELSRLDHVDPFLKEALMGSSGDFAAAGGAGGGKEEGGGIGAEGEEGTKEGEDEKKGESGGATSPPLAVAGGESGEVFTCERCGSKNIGHVHRNALEDEQERMLECSCNSCGAVWVVED